MGFHKTSATRNMRTRHAHLDRLQDGSIVGRYYDMEYVFLGSGQDTLTLKGNVIPEHPRFKGIGAFEGWCMRYYAEHDVE